MFSLYPIDLDANQRQNIMVAHGNNLDRLNQLVDWTDDDFDLALYSYHKWFEQEQKWLIGYEELELLVRDRRSPPTRARDLFEQWKADGTNRIKSARSN